MAYDLESLIVIAVGFIAILTSILVIKSKNLVYAAVYLSIVGVLNSILIALLGYVIIAVLHIIIYVGAGIMFITIPLSFLVMHSNSSSNLQSSFTTGVFVLITSS
jgi:NADH:ubiquinone oxidoreductase subunit 6 (subunit J)